MTPTEKSYWKEFFLAALHSSASVPDAVQKANKILQDMKYPRWKTNDRGEITDGFRVIPQAEIDAVASTLKEVLT